MTGKLIFMRVLRCSFDADPQRGDAAMIRRRESVLIFVASAAQNPGRLHPAGYS
jgi:hypothetical protein